MKAIIELLPVEDDRIGDYQETWYPDEDWGIGQHEGVKDNLLVGFSIWSDKEPPLLPEPYHFPDMPKSQTLQYTMPSNIVTGSYLTYKRFLPAGAEITGSLRLTGYYPSSDWDNTCCFWVYDPDGNEVHKWCEEFKEGGLFHEFSFRAPYKGEYVIKAGHVSYHSRQLHIEISTYGWQ